MATEEHVLYVNLSASEARRRLKGHGLGVRRIENAGNRCAAIFHNATGTHLKQLKAFFRDVIQPPPEAPFSGE